eukprot:5966057-Amphidinium_carterae.1
MGTGWCNDPGLGDFRSARHQSSKLQSVWRCLWHYACGRPISSRTEYLSRCALMALARIARELALELADGTYRPDTLEHLPGVLNTVADWASRLSDPAERTVVVPDSVRMECSRAKLGCRELK